MLKVIVSKLFTYKDILTICFVLEAIPLNFAVLIDRHGGKTQLVGLCDDHHDRMTRSGDSLVPVDLRDNKNTWCLSCLITFVKDDCLQNN